MNVKPMAAVCCRGACEAPPGRDVRGGVHSEKEFAMLVLSRGKNESLVINDSITITVLEIRGPIVRIGIEAPREMSIVREEIAVTNPPKESHADR